MRFHIRSSTIRIYLPYNIFRTDNFNFKELPELDKFNQARANDYNTLPFTGNPSTILFNVQGAEG